MDWNSITDKDNEKTYGKGKRAMESATNESPTLEELLAGITEENLHGEWNVGPAVGREIW